MVNEEWLDIEGYDGLYKISNFGNIISLKNKYKKYLKKCYNKAGYQIVILRKDNKSKHFYVHRLVAQTFISNPDNKPHIDHINTDRTDNRVENLRWVTHKENCNNPITITSYSNNNYMKGKFSKLNHNSKPVLQLTKNYELIKKWDCLKDVERELGIFHTAISACCNFKPSHKTAGGFIWGYADDYERVPFKVFDLEIYEKKAI